MIGFDIEYDAKLTDKCVDNKKYQPYCNLFYLECTPRYLLNEQYLLSAPVYKIFKIIKPAG